MYHVDVQLRQRNNTVKLIALVHNQFCSKRFRGMICYSWYACGYCDEKPATFQTPVEFCFDQSSASSCDLCTTSQFITRAWCKAELCISHVLLQYHFCNNYTHAGLSLLSSQIFFAKIPIQVYIHKRCSV